ncbi:molybdopterin dinucleotide binding domain-containing protein [Nocardia sp. NPDC046473]|uniref:molybdopterin dinucleotide binding domain-containing protein n=1 Tax=Nocardia sp. NPDC046473 TaxID=3155733 RepID=UPI0033E9620C
MTDNTQARITTETSTAIVTIEITDTMRPGHVALPNGMGLDYPDANGNSVTTGVSPNELTSARHQDPIIGTPWYKHVPARVEAIKDDQTG